MLSDEMKALPAIDQKRRDEIIAALKEGIPEEAIKSKEGFDYVDAHYVISAANRIFGHDGWSSTVVTAPHIVSEFTREVTRTRDGRAETATNHVAIISATVRVVAIGTHHDGVGSGVAEAPVDSFAGNLDKAFKEAETDGLKRALIKFGDPFGLTLYDKEADRRNITRKKPPTADEIGARVTHYRDLLGKASEPAHLDAIRSDREAEPAAVQAAFKEQLRKEWGEAAKRVGWEPPAPGRPESSKLSFKFGNRKDTPIADLDDGDLDWYGGCCERDLADEAKKKYHGESKRKLAAIAAERLYRKETAAWQERQAKKATKAA